MINKFYGIGNLGSDPTTRFTQAGKPVCNFSIGCSEKWKGQDGQMQESTEWINCVAWDRLAEICGEYLAKGSRVYVEGKLKTSKYKAQDGSDRYKTEVVLHEMKMLSPRQGHQEQSQGDRYEAPKQGAIPPANEPVPF